MSLLYINFLCKLWENVKTFPSPKKVLQCACICDLLFARYPFRYKLFSADLPRCSIAIFHFWKNYWYFPSPSIKVLQVLGVGSVIQLWLSCWARLFVRILLRSPVNCLSFVIYNSLSQSQHLEFKLPNNHFLYLWLKLLFQLNVLGSWPSPEHGLVSWWVLGVLGPSDMFRVYPAVKSKTS